MAVQLQILQPAAGSEPEQVFTTNGVVLCMGAGPVSVNVFLVMLDFSFSLTKPAVLTPVGGLPGVSEWTAGFTAGDGVPAGDFALYALAYDNTNALVADAEVTLDGGFIPFRKRKQKKTKTKKNGKKK